MVNDTHQREKGSIPLSLHKEMILSQWQAEYSPILIEEPIFGDVPNGNDLNNTLPELVTNPSWAQRD